MVKVSTIINEMRRLKRSGKFQNKIVNNYVGRGRYIKKEIYCTLKNKRVCDVCGVKQDKPLEIDHIKSLHNGGDNSITNLQVLCKECHRKKTEIGK
jgi:5-methylcytosine-specific restriction endonuclease McrA